VAVIALVENQHTEIGVRLGFSLNGC
jgi:hypothetical protein